MKKKELLRDKLVRRITDWIEKSGFMPGDRLLSEKHMAKMMGVNHLTLRASLAILEEQGIIERRYCSGTYLKKLPQRKKRKNSQKKIKSENLVTLLMRNTGHIYGDLVETLCRKLQRAECIPFVVPFPSDDNYVSVLEHIEKTREMGASKFIIHSINNFWLEPLSFQLGVLKGQPEEWKRIVWFEDFYIPDNIRGDIVGRDMEFGFTQAIKHLKELGCKKITFLTHKPNKKHPFPEHENALTNSYKNAMKKLGLDKYISILLQTASPSQRLDDIKNLLTSEKRPDAILASEDSRLIMVSKEAGKLNINIPGDLMLIGNGDTPWAREYSLTSISYEIDAITDALVKLVLPRPCSHNDRSSKIKIKPRLIIRESTGKNTIS